MKGDSILGVGSMRAVSEVNVIMPSTSVFCGKFLVSPIWIAERDWSNR